MELPKIEGLTVELPGATPRQEVQALVRSLSEVESVEEAEEETRRSLDVATVQVWLQLARDVLTTVAVAVPIVTQIVASIRGTKVKGVKLAMKGATLEVDEASTDDIERFVRAAHQAAE